MFAQRLDLKVRLKYICPEVRLICLNEFLNEFALDWFPVYQEITGILECVRYFFNQEFRYCLNKSNLFEVRLIQDLFTTMNQL